MTKNLARERRFMLGGLSVEEGTELFIRLADSLKPSEDIRRAIMKIVQGVGGHPLSIEILARNYKGSGLEGIENIFKNLDLNIVNPVEEEEHLRPVQASFAYSINALDLKLRNLLSNLSFFKSPFTFSTVTSIFDVKKRDVLNLYNLNLLDRIDYDKYGKIENEKWLYKFHPSVKNYLDNLMRIDSGVTTGIFRKIIRILF